MNKVQIRLGHTDSVNSINRQNFLDVELENTSKLMHYTDIKETVDQYEQFKVERENCNRYRLITTINPYCTNVLFNTFTEMVYAEGSSVCDAIVEDSDKPSNLNPDNVYRNINLDKPNRIDMIMNTEYSRPGCADDSTDKNGKKITDEYYNYHPGFDIFDNHILRNKSFKIVNKPKNLFNSGSKLFNTLGDRQRYADGTDVMYKRRESLNSKISTSGYNRHLYDHDDLWEFKNGDAINVNLTEENGWYGFINTSIIQSRNCNPENGDSDELKIAHVLNNRKSCEFIDMYPDRTLYSFNPKYNKYRHREEYNWEIILTYPYAKTDDYNVVKDNNCNGLIILSATKEISPSNETIILFRSMTKHGLKRGDTVRLYYKDKGTTKDWMTYEKDFIVKNVGDLDNNEKDYYFYITDMDFIRLMKYGPDYENTYLDYYYLKTNNSYTITIEEYESLSDDKKGLFEAVYTLDNMLDKDIVVDDNREYRFARVVGSVPSSYYIRKFKKLPNFKYARQNFPSDGSMTIDEYIENNAKDGDKMALFDKEQYKLAFESTIYNDDTTQIVFTDTIDIDNLVDDRGCPLTEMYLTVVKTNYGHDLWYGANKDNRKSEEVEFSHCFGEVSEGLEMSQRKGDIFVNEISHKKNNCGDVAMLYKNSSPYNKDVDINKTDEFLGDIVDFNPNECLEKPLQSFMHRFNTVQREYDIGRNEQSRITYHEIWSDDWDAKPKLSNNVTLDNPNPYFSIITLYGNIEDRAKNRPEGYYYQPHYRIPLREFSAVIQGQHYDINIKSIEPVQADGMYIKIKTIRKTSINRGDVIYLFDNKGNKLYDFVVTYIENPITFYVLPNVKDGNPWSKFSVSTHMNWLDVCNLAVPYKDEENPDNNRDRLLFFRKKNEEIPPYAVQVGKNKYLWRNVLNVGDDDIQELPEYAYANNAFYITKEINFFLKRQDPNNWNGLYCKESFPNDIPGNIMKESNYIYKEEKEVIC